MKNQKQKAAQLQESSDEVCKACGEPLPEHSTNRDLCPKCEFLFDEGDYFA